MREFVSVQSVLDILKNGSLKRDALIFDKMVVISSYTKRIQEWFPEWLDISNDLAWLAEKGFVETLVGLPDILDLNDAWELEYYRSIVDSEIDALKAIEDTSYGKRVPEQIQIEEGVIQAAIGVHLDYYCRSYAAHLRDRDIEAIPFSPLNAPSNENRTGPTNLVKISLGFLPTPDSGTSWEQILDFRSDPDSKAKYVDLRNWMNEICAAKISPKEAEEKLEYLITQFERHMKIHKLKAQKSVTETFVTTTAEIAEDLVKFKWGKLATSFFKLRHRKIELMEAELKAPGSSVAYFYKSKEVFK